MVSGRRLDDCTRRRIERMGASGVSRSLIARACGVHVNTVSNVLGPANRAEVQFSNGVGPDYDMEAEMPCGKKLSKRSKSKPKTKERRNVQAKRPGGKSTRK